MSIEKEFEVRSAKILAHYIESTKLRSSIHRDLKAALAEVVLQERHERLRELLFLATLKYVAVTLKWDDYEMSHRFDTPIKTVERWLSGTAHPTRVLMTHCYKIMAANCDMSVDELKLTVMLYNSFSNDV